MKRVFTMKKDGPTNDKKILKFLLEQQLPDARVVGLGRDGKPLAFDDAIAVTAVDHVTHVALETCRCIHLQEHLPHLLDLELCKAVHHPRGWVVANPVHSMHLQTQLEEAVPPSAHGRQPPVLYGEEQQRTMALNTEGIVEFWCPLTGYSAVIHDDTAMEKMEHMPTLPNVHKERNPVMVKYPSLLPTPTFLSNPMATATKPTGLTSATAEALAVDHPTQIPTTTTTTTTTATTMSPSLEQLPPVSSSSHVSDPSQKPDPVSSTLAQLDTTETVVDAVQLRVETSSAIHGQERCEAMDQDSQEHADSKEKSDPVNPLSLKVEKETKQHSPIEPMDVEDLLTTAATTNPANSDPVVPVPVPSDGQTEDKTPVEDTLIKPEVAASGKMPVASAAPIPNDSLLPADATVPIAITSMNVTSSTPLATSSSTNSESERPSVSHPILVEEKPLVLSEEKFNHLRIEEDRIRLIRRSLSSHRIVPKKKVDPKKRAEPNNKRKREDIYKTPGIPGWHPSNLKDLSQEQEQQWLEAQAISRSKVERWIENFRICRETYWDERARRGSASPPASTTTNEGGFYLPSDHQTTTLRCCQACNEQQNKNDNDTPMMSNSLGDGASTKKPRKPRRKFCGDEIMQCLDCNFVGCSPKSIARDSKQHILQHLLLTGHKFAVSCGERGQLFCFCCGDFVYHEVFHHEKARIDYAKKVPLMAWKPHQLYRSFDPFHFMKTQDHGIVWRGLVATYPQLVPLEHIKATEATSRRQALFNGEVEHTWLANKPVALTFAASQRLTPNGAKHRIQTPVGMFNLGNTCYKSAVLQCLVHCRPLQKFFLQQNGHHHHACKIYRQWEANKRKKKKVILKPEDSICLACEMDKLYLSYYGNTIGVDVRGAMDEACNQDATLDGDVNDSLEKGEPLIISEMLTASWKSGGMNSLASYKQHDSHEFMNSFLEMVGKQTKQHWTRVHSAIHIVKNDNAVVEESLEHEHDIVKTLFEGSLSSVLLCDECGNKRKRTEEFLNVSLSLAEQVSKLQSTTTTTTTTSSNTTTTTTTKTTTTASGTTKTLLSVERCLERFVTAEKLGDGVDCPSCGKKTATQKQHTFGTLPKVLCLHLKRFDAAQNKKIDDFVSFPAQGLNMGKYLAQWCEVTSLPIPEQATMAEPQIYYDLFGTVNHVGNMQSGHYVTNVNVNDRWYHFNDAHVTLAGGDGTAEAVVNNAGAYILFYVRREKQISSL